MKNRKLRQTVWHLRMNEIFCPLPPEDGRLKWEQSGLP
jgi:hypothetical protein